MNYLSIVVPLKNRTDIVVPYETIPIRIMQRNNLELSGMGRNDFEVTQNNPPLIRLTLLINMLKSLSEIKTEKDVFEVILVDFSSDDYDLDKLVNKYKNIKIKIVKQDGFFSRGKGLNIGYNSASYENIYFCDADMYFNSRELFENAFKELKTNRVFFPICFGLCEPSHQIGYWREKGFGMCFLNKNMLRENKYKWSEYDSLGKEDDDFWEFFENKKMCSRYRVNNYFHQWHPETPEFKNKYYRYCDINKSKIYTNIKHINMINVFLGKIAEQGKAYIVDKLERNINSCFISYNEDLLSELYEYKKKFNKKLEINIIVNNVEGARKIINEKIKDKKFTDKINYYDTMNSIVNYMNNKYAIKVDNSVFLF